jgi:hypothetical protein
MFDIDAQTWLLIAGLSFSAIFNYVFARFILGPYFDRQDRRREQPPI